MGVVAGEAGEVQLRIRWRFTTRRWRVSGCRRMECCCEVIGRALPPSKPPLSFELCCEPHHARWRSGFSTRAPFSDVGGLVAGWPTPRRHWSGFTFWNEESSRHLEPCGRVGGSALGRRPTRFGRFSFEGASGPPAGRGLGAGGLVLRKTSHASHVGNTASISFVFCLV